MFGDDAARGDDDPLAVLPLDRLDNAETRQHAAGRNGEHAAVAVLDQRAALSYVLHDPILQNLVGQLGLAGRRRLFVADRACRLGRGGRRRHVTFFFSSLSMASAMCASLAAGSICARSTRSRRSTILANWLLALRAVPSRLALRAELSASSAFTACSAFASATPDFGAAAATGERCASPEADSDPATAPRPAASASEAASSANRDERADAATAAAPPASLGSSAASLGASAAASMAGGLAAASRLEASPRGGSALTASVEAARRRLPGAAPFAGDSGQVAGHFQGGVGLGLFHDRSLRIAGPPSIARFG